MTSKLAKQQLKLVELYRQAPYFTRDQDAINKLSAGETRDVLQERLTAVRN